MKLVPSPIKVETDGGFTSDLLGREPFAEGLTNLFLSLEGPAVVVLDGDWGTGKSTFVDMWRSKLTRNGIAHIYFNAFDNDYLEDAFVALAGEFASRESATQTKRQKFIKSAARAGAVVIKAGVRASIKAATIGVIDTAEVGDAVSEAVKDVGSGAADAAERAIERRISGRDSERKVMTQFKESLEAYARQLSAEVATSAKLTRGTSLVFIIDELDRCRPDFALSLLEGTKHLFSVESVVFLLVANFRQLEECVRAKYGSGNYARQYLEKFIQLRLTLPAASERVGPRGIHALVSRLFQGMPTDSGQPGKTGRLHELVERQLLLLSARMSLSLRKLERIATHVAIFYASTQDGQSRIAPLIVDLVLLKLDYPEIYARAQIGRLTVRELERALPYSEWLKDEEAKKGNFKSDELHELMWAANHWRYVLGEELLGGEDRDAFARNSRSRFFEPMDVVTFTCTSIDGLHFPVLEKQEVPTS